MINDSDDDSPGILGEGGGRIKERSHSPHGCFSSPVERTCRATGRRQEGEQTVAESEATEPQWSSTVFVSRNGSGNS